MKKFILILFNLIITLSVFSQTTITLEGIVKDQDGSFISDAALHVTTPLGTDTTVYTDSDGHCSMVVEINPLGPTTISFHIEANGYVPDDFEREVTSSFSGPLDDFVLVKIGAIMGTVSLNGDPLYGLVQDVELELDGGQPIHPDEDGFYVFNELDDGEYSIIASLENYESFESIINIESTESIEVNITLELKYGEITGNISIEPMAIVTSVAVTLNDVYDTVYPNEVGDYIFDSIIPGSYNIKAALDNYYSDPEFYDQDIGPGENISDKDFVMFASSASLNGYITNIDNDPIEGATLEIGDSTEVTNDEGYYSFESLQPGEVNISISAEGYMPLSLDMELYPGEQNFDTILQNEPTHSILDGYIKNIDNDYIEGARVEIGDSITFTDMNGYYSFNKLNPGLANISISAEGYVPLSQDIELEQGYQRFDAILQYEPTHSILDGYIKNIDNDYIEGARVEIGDSITFTDINGYYSFNKLNPGLANISISAEGYKPLSQDIELYPGEQSFDTILQYKPIISIDDDELIFHTFIDETSEAESFQIGGVYLESAVTISVNLPFEISLNEGYGYGGMIEIAQAEDSTIDLQDVFVRFKPDLAILYEDSIQITSQFADAVYLSVKGTGLETLVATIDSEEDIVCFGAPVRLEAIVSGGASGEYSYQWNNGLTDSYIWVNPTEDTEYTVVIKDILENSIEILKEIQVYKQVEIIEQPESNSVCSGDAVIFKTRVFEDDNVTYQWQENGDDLGDNSTYSGCTSDELVISATSVEMNLNEYICKITRCDEESTDEAELVVIPLPLDLLIIKGGPTVLISPDSGKFYQWYKNESMIEGEMGQFYYPLSGFESNSNYYVEIENEYGCKTKSEVYSASGKKQSPILYPNPTSNSITINTMELEINSAITVIISDLSGRQLMSSQIINKKNQNLSLDMLRKGMYVVKIIDDKGESVYSTKIIKN